MADRTFSLTSAALTPFIKAPTPPGTQGSIKAAASTTTPSPSKTAPFALPFFTFSAKDNAPVVSEKASHAVSNISPSGSTYLTGLFPA